MTARDTSLAQVQGTASSPLSATTPASPGSSLTAGGTIWKVMDQNESQTYEGIGTRYQVSVHNGILRFANVRDGVDQPVDVTVVGTVADYRFHGQTGGVVGTVADGPADLISTLSTTSDGTITNRHNANFWTDTDPLDEWSSAFDGRDGMAKVADATATVDISGLRSGSIYFFYGGFGEAVDFSAVMEDTEAVQPDVSLGSFGALPALGNTTRWHVCSVDFVNDAGYDTITWTLNASNGRFFGSVLVETPGVLGGSDTEPPLPGTMSFLTGPEAVSDTSITMTSATARDNSGTEYYFACTSGGGNDSGWQYSPTYTDTGLTPGTEYTYTVQARDRSSGQNANTVSAPASAFTEVTDVLAPPASSFATGPKALSESIITMTAASVIDPGGVEYFFDETSGNPRRNRQRLAGQPDLHRHRALGQHDLHLHRDDPGQAAEHGSTVRFRPRHHRSGGRHSARHPGLRVRAQSGLVDRGVDDRLLCDRPQRRGILLHLHLGRGQRQRLARQPGSHRLGTHPGDVLHLHRDRP